MINFSFRIADTQGGRRKVIAAMDKKTFRALGRGAHLLMLRARSLVRRRKKASVLGSPPSTQTGLLKKSILFEVQSKPLMAMVGPAYELIADVGGAHEFGGEFRGGDYPSRPFMGPALEQVKDKLPEGWRGSL